MNDTYTKNTNFNIRKLRLGIMSGFIITTLVWVFAIVPQQPSRAEQIISDLQWNTWMIEKPQMNTWGWLSNNVVTNGNVNEKYKPKTTWIILNNNWNWEIKENNQEWDEFVLDWWNDFAKEVAAYLWSKRQDPVMIATFIAESWLNPWSKSNTSDYWLCQLNYTYNSKIINDDRFFSDWKWQADYCVSKWSVANHNLWMAYKSWAYKKYMYLFE